MRFVSDSYTERFDPIIVSPIPITTLQSWGRKDEIHLKPTDYSSLEGPRHRASPFPCSDSINSRFIIWEGDISLVQADAITNTTDETLTEKNIISDRIFRRAGPGLKQELLNEIRECKTGEVRMTHGYNLPAKYIIHTVGPIYSDRYKTAAETTLHSCYRNILCKAKEVGIKSIAVCVVSTVQRNFPPDIGAHIALRTIRRFLEQYKNETIVLCLEPHERGIFEVLAPLYFPRDKLEESSALWQLPKDIGGSFFGEPQIPDRQIRIIHNPQHSVMIGRNTVIRVICIIYLGFIYYDRDIGKNGGRGQGSQWFRSLAIWKYFSEYFPIELIKTVDLSADQNYIFAMFPHGVLSSSAFSNFNTNHSKWRTLFPGIRSKLMTLDFHFYVPLFREVVLAWGMASCSARSIRKLVTASNDASSPVNKDGYTANAVMIFIGGAQEAVYCHPRNYTIVLKKRKGFIKMAMVTGTSIVPCISFNEVDTFDQPANPPGSKMRRFQDYIRNVTGVTPIFFNGRGFFQYTYGWIPKRRPITTVVGSPIIVEKNENPTQEEVNKLHEQFTEHLINLFETHKAKYVEDHETVHLNII